jgi:hypothetical protein
MFIIEGMEVLEQVGACMGWRSEFNLIEKFKIAL